MRTRKLTLALMALLICSFLPAKAAPIIDAGARKKIDDVVERAIAGRSTPGCCVVIGTKREVLFAKAYGRLTYDSGSPTATLDTLYDMASCSKAVGTTSATALLGQDGKLSLDDPVSKYLSSWNCDDKRTITIRNLAAHTSGLPAYTSADAAEARRAPNKTHADALIEYIASLPLKYQTNEGYTYSCLNFLTLARVNEEAAGTSQERFLRARLFTPLGMSDTGYYLRRAKKLLCAPTIGGEDYRQGVVHDPLANYYRDGYHCPGNAGFFTTATDLSKFCRMVLSDGMWGDKRIFAPETIDLFATNQIPESVRTVHGLGWGISRRLPFATELNAGRKNACLTHSGYTGTFIEFDRLAGSFMVILTNHVYPSDTSPGNDIVRAVRRIMLETDPIYRRVLTP